MTVAEAIKPRDAVIRMAPYSPPTGGRLGKLRMDFNENTVGCSPRIAQFLRDQISEAALSVYPDYTGVREALAPHFGVAPDEILLTNGTDEAIQVLINQMEAIALQSEVEIRLKRLKVADATSVASTLSS